MPRHTHRVGGPQQRSGAAAGAPAAAAGPRLTSNLLGSGMFLRLLRQFCAHCLALAVTPSLRATRRPSIGSCRCGRRQTTQASSLPVRQPCTLSALAPYRKAALMRAGRGLWRFARSANTSDLPSCWLESSHLLGWCAACPELACLAHASNMSPSPPPPLPASPPPPPPPPPHSSPASPPSLVPLAAPQVREITQTYNSTPADGEKRWQAEALLALQEARESCICSYPPCAYPPCA